MALSGQKLRSRLALLLKGMTSLQDGGRFYEPNLDGSRGDYISFDAWEWPQGVGLYGLVRLWQNNDDETLLALLENWFQRHLDHGLPKLNVNTTTPMLALSLLFKHNKNERWKAVLDNWADRLISELPRTLEGGFQHDVSDRVNIGELWGDTLFMAALFLASYGQASGRHELVEEAQRQFLVHTHYLCDRQSGLWFHGWTFSGRHNFARAHWGRGNAWAVVGVLDLVELADIDHAVREFLLGVFGAQINALLKLQSQSGAWCTLLDDPSSYEEISATAGFGYGLLKAVRLGIGTDQWRLAGLKAVAAVLDNIDDDGTVMNVSYGTRMGHDLQFYRDIPIQPTGYGQALAILCLTEALHHVKAGEKVA
ncbi:Rhamnogalacturonides degradation protein RhiN [hydrothermal vent metagenome]|uniref:Rhamnogalacturonides degradation protein RhiN n=1 Tax=hydrothermal vent metagenome TaxID=652676 RepID=A0A3B0T616_9ZZZZ